MNEVSELRRSLRDVVAMSTLSSVWSGYDAGQIARDVADLVVGIVDPDALLLRSGAIEIFRSKQEDAALGAILRETAAAPLATERMAERSGRPLRLLSYALSAAAGDRLIVAGGRQDFPNDHDRLLLGIAANQAGVWIQRKNAEAALAAESAFRRAIENSMLAGVAIVDPAGRQTYVNRAFAEMVGWNPSELIGATPPFAYWAPEDAANIADALADVIAGNSRRSGYELRFRRRNGERFDALVLVSPITGSVAAGYLASVYDITERKRAERATRLLAQAGDIFSRSLDYEETLQAISRIVVPHAADWCFIDMMQGDGTLQRIAVAHERVEHEPVARRLRRTLKPKNTIHGVSGRAHTVLVNDVTPDLLVAAASDPDHLDALMSMGIRCFLSVPMLSRGNAFGAITFIGTERWQRFDDEQVELASELARRASLAVENARLYRHAYEANRAKDEFLANLSHELRTPMTAILGWAHLLQLGGLDEEQVRLGIDTIRKSGEAQARLIDDLLDVSRIITGKLQLAPAFADLAGIVRAAVTAIMPAAEAKRQAVAVAIAPGTFRVLCDASRLQQVFWNLLSNAVKFTPAGGKIAIDLDTATGDTVRVTIRDSGEGIAPEFIPLVFERFRQGATAQRRTGLGLGLAIAKELVEMHGGSIAAESDGVRRGATFTVTLPLAAHEAEAASNDARAIASHRLESVRVLVVDDDESTRNLLATILRSFGAEVTSASGAEEARRFERHATPDILITDIAMPEVDGVSLLHSLRTNGRDAIPAIAVTAYTESENRDRLLAAGFDAFVGKPLDPLDLVHAIEQALERRPAP